MFKPSLLWEIQNEKSNSYLFGSLHLASDRFEKLQLALAPYIQSSEVCAIEINLEHAELFDLNEFHNLKEGESHFSYISEKNWNKLCSQVRRHLDYDLNEMKNLQPFVVLNLLLQRLYSNVEGGILDEWIWNHAKENQKILDGLEDLKEHYDTLHKIPMKIQFKLLEDSISDFPSFKRKMSKLLHAYLEQDIRRLYLQAKKYTGAGRNILLKERNIKMTDKLIKLMKVNSVFSVAGAGHLYGQYGMISLLKKNGFKVKPVKITLH